MTEKNEKSDYRFAVVLNKKIEPGVALNAASHMVAALMSKARREHHECMQFMDYMDGDGNAHLVSGLSLIVLHADNSNKLRKARYQAIEKDLLYVDFTESMTGDTYVEQMARTGAMAEADLTYYGLCLFGRGDALKPITSKFSLWR